MTPCIRYNDLQICNKNTVGRTPNTDIESIVIPKTVEGTDLLYIANRAYTNCIKLKHVFIEARIISIGVYAFGDCPHLEYINIPSSVKILDNQAITGWDLSTDRAGNDKCVVVFEMGSQIEKIGYHVFAMQGLYKIFLPDKIFPFCNNTFVGSKKIELVSPYLFNFCSRQTKQTCRDTKNHRSFLSYLLYQFLYH